MSCTPLAVTSGASQRLFTCGDALPARCVLLPGKCSRRMQGCSPNSGLSVLLILPQYGRKTAAFVTRTISMRSPPWRASPESNSNTRCFEESLRVVKLGQTSVCQAVDSRGRHDAPNRRRQDSESPFTLANRFVRTV